MGRFGASRNDRSLWSRLGSGGNDIDFEMSSVPEARMQIRRFRRSVSKAFPANRPLAVWPYGLLMTLLLAASRLR